MDLLKLKNIIFILFFASQSHAAALRDSRGKTIETKADGSIVSGFVGADEILFHLMSEDKNRLLALSPLAKDKRYSAIYQEAKSWKKSFGLELESLLALKPDLVILARYSRAEWIKMLDQVGVKSFVLGQFKDLSDIRQNILNLGQLVHKEKEAKILLNSFDKNLAKVQKDCGGHGKTIVNYSEDGLVYGRNTSFDALINHIGLSNAGSKMGVEGWAKVSRENMLLMKPDYIIIAGERKDIDKRHKEMMGQVAWKNLRAVKEKKIIAVPSRYLSSVSHYIVKAMEGICAQL